LTRHSGCPVAIGHKFVMNKWLHEEGQELRRQCDKKHITTDEYKQIYLKIVEFDETGEFLVEK
jgi:hypothetical protein